MTAAIVSSNGAVSLSDMNVPQLTAANTMLDRIAGNHDHAHTAARLLQGVTLIEIKRRLEHGGWGPWLKENFDRSQDSAGRYIRVAEDFLGKLQDAKFRKRAEFDLAAAVRLLRQDLSKTLEQLEEAKLDLSNPIVRAAAYYAGGHSFNQLLLNLGDAPRGGYRTSTKPPKGYDPNAPAQIAHDIWTPHLDWLEKHLLEEKSWRDLPNADLERLKGLLTDGVKALRGKEA